MFKNFELKVIYLYAIGAIGFVLTMVWDSGWPMLYGMAIIALSLFFGNNKDEFEFRDDVQPTFSERGYTIIAERHLIFLEKMNRDPDWEISIVSINGIPITKPRYLRKYHRVFTVTTSDNETLDVLTEIIQHLDKEITIEILGTKEHQAQ